MNRVSSRSPSHFRHHRAVDTRVGTEAFRLTPPNKTLYSQKDVDPCKLPRMLVGLG